MTTQTFERFIPAGYRKVDLTRGALTGAGTDGAVLIVEESDAASNQLGEGAKRQVILLARGEDNALRVMGRNDRLVPCATCGGMAGDPYAGTRVQAGRFTIATAGGSRERWSNDYVFVYEPAARRFVLDSAKRSVIDTLSDAHAEATGDAQDLGVITFDDFDPEQIGDAPVLEGVQ